MAIRRPLVRVGGRSEQLPEGDSLAGVPVAIPFWSSDGTRADIPLTTNGELPFWLSDGTPANIPVVTSG
jgi:hypothetical protein